MRSCLVEVGHIGIEHAARVASPEGSAGGRGRTLLREALTDRIGSGSVIRCFQYFDATGGCYSSATGSEFAIMIANEILRHVSIRSCLPQLLCSPSVGRRSCHAHVDHFARLQCDDEEGKKRSKEQISDRKARRRPRPERRGCAGRSPTSGLVAGVYEQPSCTSEWCACRPEGPVSTVHPGSVQPPTVDSASPSA
jgi:hypothetical protein